MVFTDPPYLVAFKGSVHADGSRLFNSNYEDIKNDALNDTEADAFLDKVINVIKSYLNGAFYICFSCRKLYLLLNSLNKHEITYRSIIVWDKGNFTLSNMDYKSNYEPLIYGWSGKHDFYGYKGERDIWQIDRTRKNDLHPTMKPVELCAKAIENSSPREGIVLDLFGGSGSTLIAAEKLNRKCYMMEFDPVYTQVIIDRWEKFTGKKADKI